MNLYSSWYFWSKHISLALLFCVCCNRIDVYAQQYSDTTLQEFKIHADKIISEDQRIQHFTPGQKKITFDSSVLARYQQHNLHSLLSRQSPVFVKSYGMNGMATLNIRGSSAAQTQIYWNGIPIQNSAQGITDISMIPLFIWHKAHLIYGGSSALWGSGNVGGAIMLETNTPRFDTTTRLQYAIVGGAGSFAQVQYGGNLSLYHRKIYISSTLFRQTGENNFSYIDNYGQQRKNEPATLEGLTSMTQIAWKPSEKHLIQSAFWYQQDNRDIPPAMFEAISLKHRKDQSFRWMLNWQYQSGLYLRGAYLHDAMQYEDKAISIQSHANTYAYYAEAGYSWKHNRHRFLIFTPIQHALMNLSSGKKVQQSRYALAITYSYQSDNQLFNLALQNRIEHLMNQWVWLPGMNTSLKIAQPLTLKINLQRSYRAPTLNEWYYEPGGNTSLQPEHGWSVDFGYSFQKKINDQFLVKHELSGFHRIMYNWILWMGGTIWTPHNIAKVYSRGWETENYCMYALGKWRLDAGFNMTYVRATTIESHIPGDNSKGKQIPYTPLWNAQCNAGINYANLEVRYNHTFTSARYINMDETDKIKGYNIGNLELGYGIKTRSHTLRCYFQLHNIWNESYQVMAYRSMPGRYFLTGVSIQKS
jgi:vitamin B12 transporter